MLEKLKNLQEMLKHERPKDWAEFPDIELYKDQVLNYIAEQHKLLRKDARLTGAMINNYVKEGILRRTNGKRYSREHLASLTMICALKQVLSVGDTDYVLKHSGASPQEQYQTFLRYLDEAQLFLEQRLEEIQTRDDLQAMILHLAVSSYVEQALCQQLIALDRSLDSEDDVAEEIRRSVVRQKKGKSNLE